MEYKTCTEYFVSQPEKSREALKQLKECILKVVPAAIKKVETVLKDYKIRQRFCSVSIEPTLTG